MISETYFGTLSTEEIGSALERKWDDYQSYLRSKGVVALWNRVRTLYYGASEDGSNSSSMTFHGEAGEVTKVRVNHLRALGQNLLSMTGTERPAWQPISLNSDVKSQAQTRLAGGVLDHYLRVQRLDKILKKADELAVIHGNSYVVYGWNSQAGDPVRPDEAGRIIKTGEPEFSAIAPYNVALDPEQEDNPTWIITRSKKSRWDLMAQYPELAEGIHTVADEKSRYRTGFEANQLGEDMVWVYRLVHARTPAVPDGRLVEYLSKDIVLLDTPLPFERLPVIIHRPMPIDGAPIGYSPLNDLAGLQTVLDALYSIIVSNQLSFGLQNILLPDGCEISPELLPGGLNVIKYRSQNGKPEVLQLLATPGEIFGFINQIQGQMETLSGINSVARGNPDQSRGQMSGAAMALLDSKARQFAAGLIASAQSLQEDVGSALIQLLQAFASAPRMAQIAGKNNSWMLREFTGSDLESIQRVTVQNADPYSHSISGRLQIAETLLQNQLIKDPKTYIQVLQTGNLDTAIEDEDSQALLIKAENESLSEGVMPVVVPTDDDARHINAHSAVLSNPAFRAVPEIVQAVRDHITNHLENLRTKDQDLMAVLGQQPLPSSQSQTLPPAPGGSSGTPAPEGADAMGPQQDPELPNQPKMPRLPGTSTPYDPATGQPEPKS